MRERERERHGKIWSAQERGREGERESERERDDCLLRRTIALTDAAITGSPCSPTSPPGGEGVEAGGGGMGREERRSTACRVVE